MARMMREYPKRSLAEAPAFKATKIQTYQVRVEEEDILLGYRVFVAPRWSVDFAIAVHQLLTLFVLRFFRSLFPRPNNVHLRFCFLFSKRGTRVRSSREFSCLEIAVTNFKWYVRPYYADI